MSGTVPPEHALALSAVLFGIGVVGVVARRNLLVMFMGIELMLNAAGLAFVAFGFRHAARAVAADPDPARALAVGGYGHGAAFLGAGVAAAEAAVGLAVVLLLFRTRRDVDADHADLMRG